MSKPEIRINDEARLTKRGPFASSSGNRHASMIRASGLMIRVLAAGLGMIAVAEDAPREWVDSDTGHRVVRLTDERGGESLYFHYNGYSADGRWLVFTRRDAVCAAGLGTREVKELGRGRVIEAGRKTNEV